MALTEIKRDGQVSEVLLGNLGAQLNLRGYNGARKDPVLNTVVSTGNYGLIEQTTHGNHVAVPLAATATTAVLTPANSVLLVQDAGLSVGAGAYLRLYDAAGVDYVQLVSDTDGGLVLGGSGANAGVMNFPTLRLTNGASYAQLTSDAAGGLVLAGAGASAGQMSLTTLVAAGNLLWRSNTANTMTFDHAISADRLVSFQDLVGTVALLGAANVGHLLFSDNAHDIGASGATRPRDLFLARNATIGGTLGAGATTVTTLHATGAVTLDATLAVGAVTSTGTVQGTRLISTVATGTAPLTVSSTTNVPNLNATYLNDKLDTAFAQLAAASNFTTPPTINGSTIALTLAAATFTTLTASSTLTAQAALAHTGSTLGVYGITPVARQTVTGSRGMNAALLDVITKLENIGLFINATSA